MTADNGEFGSLTELIAKAARAEVTPAVAPASQKPMSENWKKRSYRRSISGNRRLLVAATVAAMVASTARHFHWRHGSLQSGSRLGRKADCVIDVGLAGTRFRIAQHNHGRNRGTWMTEYGRTAQGAR